MQTDVGSDAFHTEGLVGCFGANAADRPFCAEVRRCGETHAVGAGKGQGEDWGRAIGRVVMGGGKWCTELGGGRV